MEEESRSSFSRGRSNSFRDKVRESIREQNSEKDTPRFTPSKSPRSRFIPNNRDASTPAPRTAPSTTNKSSGSPKIVFKKFNRFDRPDRRALLRSKLFGNRPRLPFGKKPKLDDDSNKKAAAEGNPPLLKNKNFPIDNEAASSAFVLSALNDDDTLQVWFLSSFTVHRSGQIAVSGPRQRGQSSLPVPDNIVSFHCPSCEHS